MTIARLRTSVVAAVLAVVTLVPGGLAVAEPSAWTPGPARYGVGERANQPIVMRDGTVLRGTVYYPTDASGEAAEGSFPLLLTMTPYGKDRGATDPQHGEIGMGRNAHWVERGYIQAIVDVRGTGASEGSWSFLQPVEARDSVQVIDWAASLPGSSGAVGMVGHSYGALDQLTAAAAVGKGSPLKAILPIVPGDDLYRDVVGAGGVPNPVLGAEYVALNPTRNYANAVQSALRGYRQGQDMDNVVQVLLEHSAAVDVLPVSDLVTGGAESYDSRRVGYGSAFAFSSAFKRARGISPRHHRDRT